MKIINLFLVLGLITGGYSMERHPGDLNEQQEEYICQFTSEYANIQNKIDKIDNNYKFLMNTSQKSNISGLIQTESQYNEDLNKCKNQLIDLQAMIEAADQSAKHIFDFQPLLNNIKTSIDLINQTIKLSEKDIDKELQQSSINTSSQQSYIWGDENFCSGFRGDF